MSIATKQIPALLIVAAAIFCGCSRGSGRDSDRNATAPTAKYNQSAQSTLGERIQHKISKSVLTGIPEKGSLKKIRKRGILRVALPPMQPPFQSYLAKLNVPVGFNVALAGEIAAMLEVKPNFKILSKNEYKKLSAKQISPDSGFDIVFLTPEIKSCRARNVRYFFLGKDQGWMSICVPGDDKELLTAIQYTMSYLTETGIFAYLYADYFD